MTFDAPAFLEKLFAPIGEGVSAPDLPPEWFDRWQARSSRLEFSCGLDQAEADAKALDEIRKEMEQGTAPLDF